VQMWEGWAQSRRRSGGGEPSTSAAGEGVSAVTCTASAPRPARPAHASAMCEHRRRTAVCTSLHAAHCLRTALRCAAHPKPLRQCSALHDVCSGPPASTAWPRSAGASAAPSEDAGVPAAGAGQPHVPHERTAVDRQLLPVAALPSASFGHRSVCVRASACMRVRACMSVRARACKCVWPRGATCVR
jgi:hypothetical protein